MSQSCKNRTILFKLNMRLPKQVGEIICDCFFFIFPFSVLHWIRSKGPIRDTSELKHFVIYTPHPWIKMLTPDKGFCYFDKS